jgi:excisionase family DNA binding protein
MASLAQVDSDKLTFPRGSLDPDALLTAAEAAALLRVSERWVTDAGREGRLPSVPLGRNRRYRRSTILAFIERQET